MKKNKQSQIYKTNFKQNTGNIGGALSFYSSNFLIRESDFKNNIAGAGGAINNYAKNLNIINTYFSYNTAELGGAINTGGILNVNNCIFNDNNAMYGGGLFLDDESKTFLVLTNFTRNTASNGSAIYNNATLNITPSYFQDNFADSFNITSNNVSVVQGDAIVIRVYLIVGDNVCDAIFNNGNLSMAIDFNQSSLAVNQNILIFLDDKVYSSTTDNEGIATFYIDSNLLNPGNFTFNVVYEKSSIYSAIYNNYTLEILSNPDKNTYKELLGAINQDSKKANIFRNYNYTIGSVAEYMKTKNYYNLNDIIVKNTPSYHPKVDKNYFKLKKKYINDKGIEDYIYNMWRINWPHTYNIKQCLKNGGIFKIASIFSPQFFIPSYLVDYYIQGKIYEYKKNGGFNIFEDPLLHFYGYQSHFADEKGGAKLMETLIGIDEKGDLSYFDALINLISILLSFVAGGSVKYIIENLIDKKKLNIIRQALSKNTIGEFIYSNFWKFIENSADIIIVGQDNSKILQVIINRITSKFIVESSTFMNKLISIFNNPIRTTGDLFKILFQNILNSPSNKTSQKTISNKIINISRTIYNTLKTPIKKIIRTGKKIITSSIKKITKIVKKATQKTKKIVNKLISSTKNKLKKTFIKTTKSIKNKVKKTYKKVQKVIKKSYKSIPQPAKRLAQSVAKKSITIAKKIYKKLKFW